MKPRRGRKTLIPLGLAMGAALLLGLCQAAYFGWGPGVRGGPPTHVILSPGSGVGGVAASLKRAGVISSPATFMIAAQLTGAAHELKAGEYAFPARAPLASVLAAIRAGAVVRHLVTIPEGLTSAQAAAIVAGVDVLTGPVVAPPEGSILPETYEVRRGESRAQVLRRMRADRDRLLAELWRARAPGLPYRSPAEAVVMASIVEKETAKPIERPRIARVFLNRLAQGMRLESDPTVVYGLTGGEPLGHGLRVSELRSPSPYNTYLVAGLPPTPIANPGRAALAAALTPAPGDDLYFVADGTGGHVFSADLATHLRHVAHWRAIEQARAGGAG